MSNQATRANTEHRKSPVRQAIDIVVTVTIAVGLALLIEALALKPYKIPTSSMYPTLHVGQRILVNRLSTHPGIGDVVVFHPPAGADRALGDQCGNPNQGPGHAAPCVDSTRAVSQQTFVKRVVGVPGDTLRIVNGSVYRNGVKETGDYIQPCPDPSVCTYTRTITVPQGMYFMMGDNRDVSDDSRYWGPVPQSSIIGEAFLSYWPPDRIGTV